MAWHSNTFTDRQNKNARTALWKEMQGVDLQRSKPIALRFEGGGDLVEILPLRLLTRPVTFSKAKMRGHALLRALSLRGLSKHETG